MELMADLMCNFIRQRAEPDAGQGHAFSVFIKFFRLQLGVAGIPDEEEVFVFHKAQFLGNCLCFQQLISILGPTYGLGKRTIEPFFIGCFLQHDFCPITGNFSVFLDGFHALSHADGVGEECQRSMTALRRQLTGRHLQVYAAYGSEDGVLNREKYEADRTNLPQDTTETVINGGCHAGFGSYGAQKGDGAPVISAEEQQQQTADALAAWMNLQ